MNDCISTNLEVVPTDFAQLTVYSGLVGLRLHARSHYENGSPVGERFGVSCGLILTLYSVVCLRRSCDARLIDLTGLSLRWDFYKGRGTNVVFYHTHLVMQQSKL